MNLKIKIRNFNDIRTLENVKEVFETDKYPDRWIEILDMFIKEERDNGDMLNAGLLLQEKRRIENAKKRKGAR